MSTNPPSLPPSLRERLQAEPDDTRTDLEAVWALLEATDDPASAGADPDAAWTALVRERPELDTSSSDGAAAPAPSQPGTAAASRRHEHPARTAWRRRLGDVAVGLALAALVLLGGLWLWRQPVAVTAPAGQQRTASLPDGSTVDLNSSTTLTYRRGFSAWPLVEADQRRVRLEGEAFFAVAEGARPFTVETTAARITVTGTRFHVRARAEGASSAATDVAVVDGRVQVAAQQRPQETVPLSSGHASRVAEPTAAPTPPQPTNVDRVLAWRNEGFAARARPLRAVVQDLERRYDVVVRLHESVAHPERRVSLYYPGPTDLETILHDLCTARDLNYRPTSRGFELFNAPDKASGAQR